jgi:hypothetical protein
MGKTPLEELQELMPELKESEILPADKGYVENAVQMASGEWGLKEEFRGPILKQHATYLRNLAENHSHYGSNSGARELLLKAVGLIGRIE